MVQGQKEKVILRICFFAGLFSVIVGFIFALYSHSQSTLMDALYDASDLFFVALILFLTPLFHKPISEKHPFRYFQVETIFLAIGKVIYRHYQNIEYTAECTPKAETHGLGLACRRRRTPVNHRYIYNSSKGRRHN